MSPLENVKRLYLDYLNAGFKKDIIVRKLKAQFPGAKFTFKGATLYVAFGLNPEQKVLGSELNASTRLMAGKELSQDEGRLAPETPPTDTPASTAVTAASWPPGFDWYARHKETKYIVAGFVNHDEAMKFVKSMAHGQYVISDSSITRSRYEWERGEYD